ncbi:MAG: hypothetical protein ACWGON_11455, partial [Gemmatimonadota bacterium]
MKRLDIMALAGALAVATMAAACGGGEPDGAVESESSMPDRVAQFAPVTLDFDASQLDDRQKRVLRRLVEAS